MKSMGRDSSKNIVGAIFHDLLRNKYVFKLSVSVI